MWSEGVELSKEGIIVPGSALDRTRAVIECTPMCSSTLALEPKNHDLVHATYSRVFCVTLAGIANLPASWDIAACHKPHDRVHYDRAQALRLSAPSLSRQHTFSINRTTCINFKTYVLWAPFESTSHCLALLSL